MNTLRSIVAGAALLTLPAEAQDHRFETDPVVTVRENFVACERCRIWYTISIPIRVLWTPRNISAALVFHNAWPRLTWKQEGDSSQPFAEAIWNAGRLASLAG